ncbi:MAG: hypothetical protein ACHREM_01405 [Polyangiales bacterium]
MRSPTWPASIVAELRTFGEHGRLATGRPALVIYEVPREVTLAPTDLRDALFNATGDVDLCA